MSVKSFTYLNNLVNDTERGPSPSIWGVPGEKSAWVEDFLQDPRLGFHFFDDFMLNMPSVPLTTSALNAIYGPYGLYAYANATIVDASMYGGVQTLTCGTTSHQGIAITPAAGCVQILDSTTTPVQGRLAFEASVSVNNITTTAASNYDCFVGLSDVTVPAAGKPITTTANSLYNTCNLIGFQRIASVGNDWSFVYQLSGQAAQRPTGMQTLVSTILGSSLTASQVVKLGFDYNPAAGFQQVTTALTGQTLGVPSKAILRVFVNGLPCGVFLSGTNISTTLFPQAFMGPTLALMNSSTATTCSMNIDWWRVAQSAFK